MDDAELLARRERDNRVQKLFGDIWYELRQSGMTDEEVGIELVARGELLLQGHVPLLWIADHDPNGKVVA